MTTADRRHVLRMGGVTVLGVLLASCSEDDDPSPSTTSTTEATTSTTDAADATGDDVVLLRTATSFELLAVTGYQLATDAGRISTPVVAEALALFQQHHREHAAQLQSLTASLGGEPFQDPNPFLLERVVEPATATLVDEPSILAFIHSLETTAAQTYTFSAGLLSTPPLRQEIMAVGGSEARHVAVLAKLLGQPQVPEAFLPTTEAVPEDAFVS